MTLEELQEFMKDEKNAAGFKELAKAVGYETPEDIQRLKAKNTELIMDKKKLKEQMESIQKRLDGIDIEEYNELKQGKQAKPSDEAAQLKRDLAKVQRDFAEANERAAKTESVLNATLIEATISRTLEENGFKSHKEILKAAFQGKAKIEIEGDKRQVVLDNGDGLGLPANEFFKTFAMTDMGKQYLDKPDNRGTGASSFSGAPAPTDAKYKMQEAERKYKAAVSSGDLAGQKAAADEAFYWKEQAIKS